jgi:hypothetical protein
MKTIRLLFLIIVVLVPYVNAQSGFSVEEYKNFLRANANMDSPQLLEMNNAGTFSAKIKSTVEDALFFDSVSIKYELTEFEKELIKQNGFMVSERLSKSSFGEALADIYHKDLPVYISADAILHAFHISYDRILKDVETQALIANLTSLLNQMHTGLPQLAASYSVKPEMEIMLKDVDVYLSVAEKLLTENTISLYPENEYRINHLFEKASDAQGMGYDTLFADACVIVDWSQFKPRGHYTDQYKPELARYFKTMMWLGRIEFYLIPPDAFADGCLAQDFNDVKRQVIDAFLITKLMDITSTWDLYNEIEEVLKFFVGEQDNVAPANMAYLQQAIQLQDPEELLDSLKVVEFTDSLKQQSFAYQKILSQILYNEGVNIADSIVPASSFMLFGQRFVIDSYVTGSVVYDRVRYNDQIICRLFPSALDPMFALGNDAAAQLLVSELDQYHYSSNLAALRYLIDAYDEEFWSSTIYTSWLNMIRKLNPPKERGTYPEFMQTAAYWQSKLNTQLASWAQLRHDNLLYAKQSYTGGFTCSYPYAYVEPFPELYRSIKEFAEGAVGKFNNMPLSNTNLRDIIQDYYGSVVPVMDTLTIISEKLLSGLQLTEKEDKFLKCLMIRDINMCGAPPYYGWYADLFYMDNLYDQKGLLEKDHITADIHTTPTDCGGITMGWVTHVGTGNVNLGIYVITIPSGEKVAFAGPSLSYYEYVTENFVRLTDDEWADEKLQSAARPEWVNTYLANSEGGTRGEGLSLLTSVKADLVKQVLRTYLTAANYPNPFNPSTIISFTIPAELTNSHVKLVIYNIQGEEIITLVNEGMPSGNYLAKWDGVNSRGQNVPSGVYLYNLTAGDRRFAGKMTLLK